MIHFPKTIEEAVAVTGEIRAGGIDLQERRHQGISSGDLVDLRDLSGLDRLEGLEDAAGAAPAPAKAGSGSSSPAKPGREAPASAGRQADHKGPKGAPAGVAGKAAGPGAGATPATRSGPSSGGMRIGALVRVAALAGDARVQRHYPALAQTAGGLATPEVRAVATVGGNLLQRVRCWYFRNPDFPCLKKGGSTCFARQGDHLYHACFDLGPCAAPHPSSIGLALLAYDAEVEVHGAPDRTIAALFGDGSDPRREHHLEPNALLTGVLLPAPWAQERAAYFRAISRARAEWPLVEVVVRLKVEGNVTDARVVVGGVANIPLRLPAVERALIGRPATAATLEAAAALAGQGAQPLPMTGYKVELLPGTVLETLERAMERGA